nr:sushi, von Willebrand factor type A, EGF and pentraxin domain-containing protein 1-like [Lytechinus pictus]
MALKMTMPIFFLLFYTLFILRTDGCSLTDLILENGGYFSQDGDSEVEVGELVFACCNNGFVRRGPEKVQCLSAGQFSDERPTCEDIDECNLGSLLATLEDDGEDTLSSLSSFSYSHVIVDHPLLDDVDQVTCQGWGLLPSFDELCHSNARCTNTYGSYNCLCHSNYIGDGIRCEEDNEPCEPASPPANGYIWIDHGRSVDFKCNSGYILIGNDRQNCRMGKWEPEKPECIDITVRCPEPVAPLNGRIVSNGGNRHLAHITFACNSDYDLIGAGIRQCLRSGRWSGRAPRCKPKRTLGDVATDIQRNIIDPFTSYTNSSVMRQNLARSAGVPSLGLDIVLAYDRSSSLARTDLDLVVNFTKQLLSNFGVSYDEGGTRVAALTFSNTAEMVFSYSDGVDTLEKVYNHLDTLKDNIGGGTGLKEGLLMVSTDLEPTMREGAKRILFIFTDGRHTGEDPFKQAGDLRGKGVEIFAVGVGRQIDQAALQQIASFPHSSHFFYIKSFDDLSTLTNLINSSEIDYKPCGEAGNVLVGDGYHANAKAWPWLSVIQMNSSTGWKMICSGTLLCQQWVLTTSSCFAAIPDSDVIREQLWMNHEDLQEKITIRVTLGEYNTSLGEGCEQAINVDRIVLHENFDYENLHDNDIALLHLSEPADLNSCVRTICLPFDLDTRHNTTVVGWGTAGVSQSASDVPFQLPMPLAPQDICRRNHGRDGFDVTDRMLCAGTGRIGVGHPCYGDIGSPLMYKRGEKNEWALLGVSTKGDTCSSYNRYGIYTRIDEGWINGITGDCYTDHIPTEIDF